eukprot:323943-Chlamydomonas_euryale.AAC.1
MSCPVFRDDLVDPHVRLGHCGDHALVHGVIHEAVRARLLALDPVVGRDGLQALVVSKVPDPEAAWGRLGGYGATLEGAFSARLGTGAIEISARLGTGAIEILAGLARGTGARSA